MVDGMGDDLAKQEWLAQGNPQFYDGVVSFQKIFVTNSRALEVVGSYLTSQINEITLAAQDDDLKHVYVLAQNQQAMVHAAHERSKITAGNAEHLFRTRVNWATSTGARQLTWLKKPMERSQDKCKDRIPDQVIEALQDEQVNTNPAKQGWDINISLRSSSQPSGRGTFLLHVTDLARRRRIFFSSCQRGGMPIVLSVYEAAHHYF